MEKKRNLDGQPGYVSVKLDFTDTESDPYDGYGTDILIKHPIFDDDMAYFDNTTVTFFPKIHFHGNVLKFFLG